MYRTVLCSVLVVVGGCGLSETVVTTGIVGANAKNQVEALQNVQMHANRDVAENNVRQAIALFQAEKGSLPRSLDQLVDERYLNAIPALPEGYEFDYNPFTGEIGTRKAMHRPRITTPQLPAATPSQYTPNYTQPFGRQPQRFAYPRTSQFGQQPQPQQFPSPSPYGQPTPSARRRAPTRPGQSASRRARGTGAAGIGPMGEVMTGIGIQNQLNSMSGSATSTAGSYGRYKVNRSTQQHQQRQERALRDLGL